MIEVLSQFSHWLCPETPALFRCDIPVSEAISRLREELLAKGFWAQFPPTSISVITPDYVRVYRSTSWRRRQSGVTFEGKFTQDAAGPYLVGRFAADQANRVLIALMVNAGVSVVLLVGIVNLFNPTLSTTASCMAPIFSLIFSAIIVFGLARGFSSRFQTGLQSMVTFGESPIS